MEINFFITKGIISPFHKRVKKLGDYFLFHRESESLIGNLFVNEIPTGYKLMSSFSSNR